MSFNVSKALKEHLEKNVDMEHFLDHLVSHHPLKVFEIINRREEVELSTQSSTAESLSDLILKAEQLDIEEESVPPSTSNLNETVSQQSLSDDDNPLNIPLSKDMI